MEKIHQDTEQTMQRIANSICRNIPEDYELSIIFESGSAWVELTSNQGATTASLPDSADKSILEQINEALCVANKFK